MAVHANDGRGGGRANSLTDCCEGEAVWRYLVLLHQNQKPQGVPAPFVARSNRGDRRTAGMVWDELGDVIRTRKNHILHLCEHNNMYKQPKPTKAFV